MKRFGVGVVLALSIAMLACAHGKPNTQTHPTRFNDNGVPVQKRVSRYFEQSVIAPKLRDCWSRLQGEGAIAMDFSYRKSADNWAFDKLAVTKSTLAKGQDALAQRCMEESVRATSFPVEPGEPVERAARQFVVRLGWSVPLPAEGTQMTDDQIARMMGGGGLGDIAGCSECVERTEYPYGLKCEARTSGGHTNCEENSTNVCSTDPTACFHGVFGGTRGIIAY